MTRQKETTMQRLGRAALVVPLCLLLLPILLLAAIFYWMYRITLYLLIWLLWLRNGKDVLFVYSDSPIWHEYMTTQILPLVQERAVVLNWSERNTWSRSSLGVAVFHHFGGAGDFNPLVVFFQPLRLAKIYRFWSAFKDWK